MAEYFDVHPKNPQHRALTKAVDVLNSGGVIVYPTDSGFALGTKLGNARGLDRIRKIRKLDKKHNFTLVVSEFAQLGRYVDMSTPVFRAIKAATPGSYTFILSATREIPRIMQHPKKKTIGVRVPDHVTALALLDELGEPIVSSTLILPGDEEPMSDGREIYDEIGNEVDLILDSKDAGRQSTTVVDFTTDAGVEIARYGAGDPTPFEN